MDTIDVCTLQNMLLAACDEIIQNEPYLTEIDTIIGDGDHGTGMKRGFEALKKLLQSCQFATVPTLCNAVGMELVKTMGGASGVIFGTMFIGGLSKLSENQEVSLQEFANYLDQGCQAVQQRGKAKAGQKTMLDALIPATEALTKAAQKNNSTEKALESAYQAVCAGVEASKSMQSRTGRSKNFSEATIGWPDPGAISTSLIFKAFWESYPKAL